MKPDDARLLRANFRIRSRERDIKGDPIAQVLPGRGNKHAMDVAGNDWRLEIHIQSCSRALLAGVVQAELQRQPAFEHPGTRIRRCQSNQETVECNRFAETRQRNSLASALVGQA